MEHLLARGRLTCSVESGPERGLERIQRGGRKREDTEVVKFSYSLLLVVLWQPGLALHGYNGARIYSTVKHPNVVSHQLISRFYTIALVYF